MTKPGSALRDPSRLCREFAGVDLVQVLGRPPWHVATTKEIAEAAGISFGRLSNWIVRGQFARSEPRHLYRLSGNKAVFRLDRVTEWWTGAPVASQAVTYLDNVGLGPDGRDVWPHVLMLERLRLFQHFWRPRDLEAYLASL